MRAWLKLFVNTFDWLSWFPCTWTMRDHHRPLSWCKHVVIWPLTWLVEIWKVPCKTPLLAYINQELRTIKRNCLDRTPVASDCLSLAKGLGWRTAGSLFLRTTQLCWGKFHCLSLSAERPLQERTSHSKHPLPTTEKTLHMDITRWSTPKSDWLYSLQTKMEKLYRVSKNKTRSWLWLWSWTPYC